MQQQQQHSPIAKKCPQQTTGDLTHTNPNDTNTKSVAQRVMDVANSTQTSTPNPMPNPIVSSATTAPPPPITATSSATTSTSNSSNNRSSLEMPMEQPNSRSNKMKSSSTQSAKSTNNQPMTNNCFTKGNQANQVTVATSTSAKLIISKSLTNSSNSMSDSDCHQPATPLVIEQISRHHHNLQAHHLRQSSSREYLNDVDEIYDEHRYDNAMVEKNMAQGQLNNNHDNDDNNQQLKIDSVQLGVQHQSNSTPPSDSPKAKSAPTTPCNVTPTAFHQNTSHINSILSPSPANTLPPDIRKNISATCRALPRPIGLEHHQQSYSAQNVSSEYLDDLIKRGESGLDSKDYVTAIRYFSQCIELATNSQNITFLKNNFKVYGFRAEAHYHLGNYDKAIDDSMAARELNPKWTQAYYLQGKSQFMNGQYANSLAVFAFGLAQDSSNEKLFDALVDAALKSNFKQDFEPKFKKLQSWDLARNPHYVVSILGQNVLAQGHGEHAAIILESALKIGSDNRKFKGSLLSTIALAYSMMKDYEKAIAYMNKELDVVCELEDVNRQCRVLSNLGYAYYKLRKFDKSLESHRKQLNLAIKSNLFPQASVALDAIGRVHAARNDFSNALISHTRCLDILKQLGDNDFSRLKEILSIGHIHCMMNDHKQAEERYVEASRLLQNSSKLTPDEFQIGSIMLNFNMAQLALKKQSYLEAVQSYICVKNSADMLQNGTKRYLYLMRAEHGLGHAYRLAKKFEEAKVCFQRQKRLAETIQDQVGQSQALANLGMVFQHFGDQRVSKEMFEENLRLVDKNPMLKAYALSYIASAHLLEGHLNEAQNYYDMSLNLFKELDYCSAEIKTIEVNKSYVQENIEHPNPIMVQQKKVMLSS